MITKLLTVFAAIIGCMMLIIVCFFYLCMNAFTIPVFIICWLICKLIKVRTPRPALYSLMLYPSWRQDKRPASLTMYPDGASGRSGKLFARPGGTTLYGRGKNDFSEYCRAVESHGLSNGTASFGQSRFLLWRYLWGY